MMTESDVPLIQALLTNPDCYDHLVSQLRLIETHISWVLLTGEYAYKIKKPVNLGFLDFSTLALRQQACEDEIRLNRRLAPDFYLGVMDISGTVENPRINVGGDPFEYAVKMRQFPPEATLDHCAERGELTNKQMDSLAARLAQFHLDECARASCDSSWGEPDVIAQSVTENFQLLLERLDAPQRNRLSFLQDWSSAEHDRLIPLMRERKRDGWVRECHGDLHLGNLAWVKGELLIFDGIEFSPALRWIDIISEVAFCYMDLLHRQQRELAMRFLNAWLEASGDYEGVALLRYYAVYRAMVRAKVAALRLDQLTEGPGRIANVIELESCLALAERLAQYSQPQLGITHGLSGSGKTTQTQLLLQRQAMIRLRSDVERKRLAGLDVAAHSGSPAGGGLYAPQFSLRTYQYLAKLAGVLLNAGWPVIVDAACLERWQRDLFRDLAQQQQVDFRIYDVQTDFATLRARVAERSVLGGNASEADMKVLLRQIETAQSLDTDEFDSVVVVHG